MLLLSCRVCRPKEPGHTEPTREEKTGLHPWADTDWGEICERLTNSSGGNGHESCEITLCINYFHLEKLLVYCVNEMRLKLSACTPGHKPVSVRVSPQSLFHVFVPVHVRLGFPQAYVCVGPREWGRDVHDLCQLEGTAGLQHQICRVNIIFLHPEKDKQGCLR